MYKCAPKSIFCIIASMASFAFFASSAFGSDYTIALNKTQILHLPTEASAIILGNPDIADVSVHSPDTLFIVGRGYGETNMIILDRHGQTVMDANITVTEGMSKSAVHIYKLGSGRETYNCAPYCLQSPVLGDSSKFIGLFGSSGSAIRNTTVSPTPLPSGPPQGKDPRTNPSNETPY